MDDRLITLLETAGADGFTALYVYWALEYTSLWIIVGLCIWGLRAGWKFMKENT